MCSAELYELRIVPNYPGDELTVVDCMCSSEMLLEYIVFNEFEAVNDFTEAVYNFPEVV